MGTVTKLRSMPSVQSSQCEKPIADPELSDVLSEMSRMMNADGAIISLHPAHPHSPDLLGACVPDALGDDWRMWLQDSRLTDFGSGSLTDPLWLKSTLGSTNYECLLLPVTPIDGHNRMVVSVMFRHPNKAQREHAEQLFATRRPMATGYFRLWQLERVRARNVAALRAACDITDVGIVLLTQDGAINFFNAAAGALLQAGDGIRQHRLSIRATHISDDVKLQVAINHSMAANEASETMAWTPRRAPLVRLKRLEGEPLVAIIIDAKQRAMEPSDVAVMIYFFVPTLDMDRMLKPVCDAFKLSRVEGQLACYLAEGRSITDAAKRLKIQVQTARGYLKNIFLKTDTSRQGELVHLMLSNMVRVGAEIVPQVL